MWFVCFSLHLHENGSLHISPVKIKNVCLWVCVRVCVCQHVKLLIKEFVGGVVGETMC